MQRAYDDYNKNRRFRRQFINTCLSEFFITLFRIHEHDIEIPLLYNAASSDLIYILQYIQEHYNTVTLNDLAKFFNFSKRHIQRMLENATDMSFKDLVQSLRMKEAARLLTNTTLSVEQISEKVGYSSGNNFRRIFSHHYGCSPRQFRKSIEPVS